MIGYSFVHTAIDDHCRLAYSEIHPHERKDNANAFWHRAHAFFAGHGITVERVLTYNGSAHKSHAWRDALTAVIPFVSRRRTRPGKATRPRPVTGPGARRRPAGRGRQA